MPLFDPADFRIPPGITHVCAGGETPFLRRHDAALLRYAQDKSGGPPGRDAQDAVVLRARDRVATAWGVARADIGFCAHVAEGVSLVVESLDWQPGDNIVVDPDEYPSVVAPLALQRHPKVELRFARIGDAAAVAAQVDARTRMIGVSAVSFLTGERHDLAALRRVADQVGALLVVDYTQAAGYLEIRPDVADFAFAACYKWLLGMTGTAIAYWNRARQPGWMPGTAGWHSIASMGRPDYAGDLALVPDAMRFARGNPAHASLYVLDSALDYLAGFAPAAVQAHVQGLTTALLARLDEAGIASTTPAAPARHGASVCIASPDAAAITRALFERGVYAWNGRGRIRFSFHGFNTAADVERIMAALREEWRG
ncbi:aminotransferase class V-fold PLP-dependent enzyme [Siccirubricoccus sp. G192]|uniref:aminotransferase class V-fold PLP-dependent enzyme n=1 Tax=Siccirubricoccus sp. G192 TaxID=2849651 RepID=UPI001C2C0CCF|nr:aminotransferase class V-fold PLP-dependent enzyme [Siccirubricoccus sp. G192]MBV1799710.1 aminotransferase class V-fold PLP-dependent enzyme [Siccirubricoccus sp. G192]